MYSATLLFIDKDRVAKRKAAGELLLSAFSTVGYNKFHRIADLEYSLIKKRDTTFEKDDPLRFVDWEQEFLIYKNNKIHGRYKLEGDRLVKQKQS